MKLIQALNALAFTSSAFFLNSRAHSFDDGHDHMKRTVPTSSSVSLPWGELPWGEINFLHTTDMHCWLSDGHTQPIYSATLGDYYSFVVHMKQKAAELNVDLLIIDTGDHHDGTGLCDKPPPGQVQGHATNEILKKMPFDYLALGNHELYIEDIAYDTYFNYSLPWGERFIASNINITIPDEFGHNVSVPFGKRYTKFTTERGRTGIVLGVMYDFTGYVEGTYVQPTADMITEPWFLEVISQKPGPDFWLLIGHMPANDENWRIILNAIRKYHPKTPAFIFSGHSHIRDCNKPDNYSMNVESGRYMETIGFMGANISSGREFKIDRRYIDNNRVSLEYHTKLYGGFFDTIGSYLITAGLNDIFTAFDLGETYGVARNTFYQNQYPINNTLSMYSLLANEIIPYTFSANSTRRGFPFLACYNNDEVRYDLTPGNVTVDSVDKAMPFDDQFGYLTDIPIATATGLADVLNGGSSYSKRALDENSYPPRNIDSIFEEWLKEMWERSLGSGTPSSTNLTPGYVTNDSCPGVGDDTLHTALSYYPVPDYLCTGVIGNVATGTNATIDLVFITYIQNTILKALNSMQPTVYTAADVLPYTPLTATDLIPLYAKGNWNNASISSN